MRVYTYTFALMVCIESLTMGWDNMFEEFDKANKKAPASSFANMFGEQPVVEQKPQVSAWQALAADTKKPEPKKKEVFAATNWADLTKVMMTPFEVDVRELAPLCNIGLVEKWVKTWEVMFEKMAVASETLSHEMLNLTQDLSRVHTSQTFMFETIQNGLREVDQAFNPPAPTGMFAWMKSSEPELLTNDEVNAVVNKVQDELKQLKVKIDPFIIIGLERLREDVTSQFNELEAATVALEYQLKFGKCNQEYYDRQIIRLHNIKTILSLSDAGVTQLNKQIQSRTTQLSDFKLQAVPMVVIKLQQYIINKDASSLKGAFVDILEMKLE